MNFLKKYIIPYTLLSLGIILWVLISKVKYPFITAFTGCLCIAASLILILSNKTNDI